ncbi:hypothetical protein ACFLYF_06465 [Chloroflexota bacterium]
MFYQTCLPQEARDNRVSALVTLTPSESKRLIARGVAEIPEIKKALEKGLIIIARGTTNAFVAEEIIGMSIDAKADEYGRGLIAGGELRVNMKRAAERNIASDFVLRQGKLDEIQPREAIKEFTGDDVFIKGASALDASGQAAVLVADGDGGTIGWALPTVTARAAHLIVPVGLEKLIPSVVLASPKCGIFRFKYSTGLPCALIPLINAKVVTELQAFELLTEVAATHVASGGIGGSEGAVVLALEGSEAAIEQALELVKAIKGEAPVKPPQKTTPGAAIFNYNPKALRDSLGPPPA